MKAPVRNWLIVASYEFHSCVGTGFGPWRQNFDAKRVLKNSDATMHKARSIKPRMGRLQQTPRDHPAPGKFIFSCQPDPKHQHQGNSSNLRFRFQHRRPSRSRPPSPAAQTPKRSSGDPQETLKVGYVAVWPPAAPGMAAGRSFGGLFGSSVSTFLLVFDGEVGNPWPVNSSDAPGWSAAIHSCAL